MVCEDAEPEFRKFQLAESHVLFSLVDDDQVVFNIMGNKYRLIVRFAFCL